MAKPRSLQQVFSSGDAAALIERARQLQSLTALLRQCLSTEMAPHVQVANWRGEKLFLQTDSTSWAARLRYQAPQLLRCLQQSTLLAGLRQLELRVAPMSRPATPVDQPLNLSAASAALIDGSADTISHPALRAALKRLARRGHR